MSMIEFFSVASPARRSTSIFAFAAQAAQLHRQRKALKRLSDRELSDIGLTRAQANHEAARPFWDAPSNWMR